MSQLEKLPESTAVIRFQDCDPFGHLNNARYIDYFFNAREDHLAKYYNFSIFGHGRETGANWVVTRNQIAYLTPATVGEEVRIQTALIHFTESDIVVEALMLDHSGRRLKAIGWSEFAYVSLATGKRATHPESLMAIFRPVWTGYEFQPDRFSQRVETIRKEYRRQSASIAQ